MWESYLLLFDSRKEALDHINSELHTNYQPNRLSEFITGARPTPEPLRNHIRRYILPVVLYDHLGFEPPEKTCDNIHKDLS